MIALVVTITIKPQFRDRFIEELLGDAKGANEDEPGCLRFDAVQDASDPNKIHLYEVYKDQAAIEAHRKAPHYLKWRQATDAWRDGDPVVRQGTPIYPPAEAKAWKK